MIYRDNKKIDTPAESREEDSDNETALIPKSLLAGYDIKPGDEVRFKVLHAFDDELEIEYAHKDDEKTKDSPMPPEEGMEELAPDA